MGRQSYRFGSKGPEECSHTLVFGVEEARPLKGFVCRIFLGVFCSVISA